MRDGMFERDDLFIGSLFCSLFCSPFWGASAAGAGWNVHEG